MKNILLIATGGTIACSSSDEGLTPSANVNELLSYIPHIKEKCKLSGISIMNIDSTNMNPELMMNIAKTIKEYKDDYDYLKDKLDLCIELVEEAMEKVFKDIEGKEEEYK